MLEDFLNVYRDRDDYKTGEGRRRADFGNEEIIPMFHESGFAIDARCRVTRNMSRARMVGSCGRKAALLQVILQFSRGLQAKLRRELRRDGSRTAPGRPRKGSLV